MSLEVGLVVVPGRHGIGWVGLGRHGSGSVVAAQGGGGRWCL
jgi:hypothetical protein